MNARKLAFQRLFITCLTVLTLISGVMAPTTALASENLFNERWKEDHTSNAAPVGTWCVAGSFNGWNNNQDALADDGQGADLVAGDGIFSRSVTVAVSGRYEWKVVKCEDWSTSFPAANSWFFTSTNDQAVTFTFDTNDHSADAGLKLSPAENIVNAVGDTLPTGFTAVGDFQDWNNTNQATAMTDMGHGIFRLAYTIPAPGAYIGKVVATGTWDSYGADGRSTDGQNITFTTTSADQNVIFLLDTRDGRVTITPNGNGTASWCAAGQFNGWNNASTPLNDAGENGDLVGGDGVYSLDVTISAAGHYEWKAVECGNWNVAYPAANSWWVTTAASQVVKLTFDTNNHGADAGLKLLPAQYIVNAWDTAPSSVTAVGDFQGWNNANPDTVLTSLGQGRFAAYLPIASPGSFVAKAVATGSWDSYGAAGRSVDGQNTAFQTYAAKALVFFFVDIYTGRLAVVAPPAPPVPGHDNNVEWDGLRHDSRDLLYRTPGGAVAAGKTVTIRFRTFHNDVTGVKLRLYSVNANAQSLMNMTLAASDVSCYQEGLENSSCDYWAATVPNAEPDNLWYRFFVTDGTDTDYYADNTPALDGGLGATTEDAVDQSYALMFYDPAFTAPAWAESASIYQIFPDRFRSGRSNNDPKTGDVRYDDPVIKLPWGTLPEGYCRNYADGDTNCPWRFDDTPPQSSPDKEQPRGRDYFGGDLKGVDQYLDYLALLGVNTIYFNPIFDAASNHGYDTQDYYKIDPYFGTQKDWEDLVKHANQRGIKIVLDGVFNHLSSDSMFFDRYHHFATEGACESRTSPYRSWFYFHDVPAGQGTCVGSTGEPNSATYDGWFGFDSIPVINKSLPEVQQYFLTDQNSVSRYWLGKGASGWRLDVMGDASFPAGYWETFRDVVKETNSDAVIISETWQKDSTLLRMLRGDRADTTMNYRLRDAVIGFLAPGSFDSKGFADSGRILLPSEFAARLESIREDYPDAAYYSLMNLLDSHDTERLRWTLTPGTETTAEKEQNSTNVAQGKLRQSLASLVQFTVPGAPTVFYGDEVSLTGDDDPDDRRTYPWQDRGGTPDQNMFAHYQALNSLRKSNDVLVHGDFKILLADDNTNVVAYGRKTDNQAAIIIINRGSDAFSSPISVAGYLPDGVTLQQAYAVGTGDPSSFTVENGALTASVGSMSAVVLISGNVDLAPTDPPTGLQVTEEGNGSVSLAWNSVPDADGYNLYRSPLSGGGWTKVNDQLLASPDYIDTGLQNATLYYYVVTAVDGFGNESDYSNEVNGLPHLTIGWANLQWPPTLTHTISVTTGTDNVYGQVWIDGATNQPGATESLRAQLGFGPDGSNPDGNADWTWVDASFNADAGNNDEFVANMLPESTGVFDYAYRYTTSNGRDWVYADLDGIDDNGYTSDQAGSLTVNPSDDTTAPAVPTGLTVVSASPAGVELTWDAVLGDASLYGYEVMRSDQTGGPYTMIARLTATSYSDQSVEEGATYFYVVRSLDNSFNRSPNSGEVTATAQLRTVTLTFNVTVPASTVGTGRSVYIAGTLSRLDGGHPDWAPGGVVMTQVDATHWRITFTGKETTQLAYKYTLGDWDHVEKGATCGEISDRQLTLSYGSDGTQTVNDTVLNWRNVSPCGN